VVHVKADEVLLENGKLHIRFHCNHFVTIATLNSLLSMVTNDVTETKSHKLIYLQNNLTVAAHHCLQATSLLLDITQDQHQINTLYKMTS